MILTSNIVRFVAPLAVASGLAMMPSCDDGAYECTQDDVNNLFAQRIEPILRDDRPKSCNQCHLSGIDLSLFVQATPCQTMACMAEQGLVDLEDPPNSLILSWIERAQPESVGITPAVIDEEYDGFLQWIEHTANCDDSLCPSFDNPCDLAPTNITSCKEVNIDKEWVAYDDPGGCDDLVLEEMFKNDVYAFRGRCFPCHWTDHPNEVKEAPKWLHIGECDIASLSTLRELESRGYIDIDDPMNSKILTKPLDEQLGGVAHGGGTKFHKVDEKGYIAWVHFVNRYAECRTK